MFLMAAVCKVLVDFINNYQKAVEDNKAQEEAEKKKKEKEEKEKAEKERQEKSKADRPASPGDFWRAFSAYQASYWNRPCPGHSQRVSSYCHLLMALLYRAVCFVRGLFGPNSSLWPSSHLFSPQHLLFCFLFLLLAVLCFCGPSDECTRRSAPKSMRP
jgi:hypothetical protein